MRSWHLSKLEGTSGRFYNSHAIVLQRENRAGISAYSPLGGTLDYMVAR